MADQIELRALRVTGICGALPEEQERAQPLEVDLEITADLAAAGTSDSLEDTVDYGELCRLVDEVISGGRFRLLERLATRLTEVVLDHDRRIESVTVAVRKLRPPVPQQLATSGVRIARSRAN
jgi:dihydroneopterin aldolase